MNRRGFLRGFSFVVIMPGTSFGQTPADGTFNVLDYGADRTGATSSQPAFMACAADVRGWTKGPGYGVNQRAGTMLIPKGRYSGIDKLDFTNCVGVTIQGQGLWGSTLYTNDQAQPYPVFDFAGSSACSVRDISIFAMNLNGTEPAVRPQCAILFADTAAVPASSNVNECLRVSAGGYWSKSALALYRTTNSRFDFCRWGQTAQVGPAVYVGTNNIKNYSSAFAPLAAPGFICADHSFHSNEMHGAKRADAVYAPLHLDGTDFVTLSGSGIVDSNGAGQPYVYFTGVNNSPKFQTKFYSENGTPCGSVFYAAPGAIVDRLENRGSYLYTVPNGPVLAGPGTFTNINPASL